LLAELPAQRVHVLSEGRIVASGGPELAEELERTGYAAYREDAAAPGEAGLGDAGLGELGLGETFPGGL
jgi:Fe-S cluster assembly ATP-binding protein